MKERIDILLVERRLVESRTKAQWLIKKGYVYVNNKQILKPGKKVENALQIKLEKKFPYVSRGGLKLDAALREFSISVENQICADIGASVGGFTDCLIQNGAKKVYAIDIASNLLHPSLICEKMRKKVIPMSGIDARSPISIEEKVEICTIDVTFASLKTILPNLRDLMVKDGSIVALVKPLFEYEFQSNSKLEVIQDSTLLSQILDGLIRWCKKNHLYPRGIIRSPVLGKEGAIEFFIHIKFDKSYLEPDFKTIIKKCLE
ncbi:MAG: TlyA family RNA methyltransferase [Candidatus Thorarchaeota archaeon]